MPKDYAHRSNVKPKRNKTSHGILIKIIILLVLGMIIVGGFYAFKKIYHRSPQIPKADDNAIVTEAKPESLTAQNKPAQSQPATVSQNQPDIKPRNIKLDFYQMLPRMQVTVDTTTDVSTNKYYYILQLASFTDRNEAITFQNRIQRLGFNPQIQQIQQARGIRYRVQIGEFKRRGDAEDVRDNLQKQNIDCILLSIKKIR